jgi:hypothetical protein
MEQSKQGKYESLREQYPPYISLDQLHKICGIAKRSAKYLVEHGIIPAHDTGRQTWRYKIAIDDAIDYLRRREQVGSMIPCGIVTSRKRESRAKSTRKCFAQLVTPGHESEIGAYFDFIYMEYNGLLTTLDVVEMTGLEKSTVLKLLKIGAIKSIATQPKYLIPKQYLLEFVVTPRFIEYRTNSERKKKIISGFEMWKAIKIGSVKQ